MTQQLFNEALAASERAQLAREKAAKDQERKVLRQALLVKRTVVYGNGVIRPTKR